MGYGNCCQPGTVIVRRYPNREERKRWLESYKDELEQELQGVQERIAALTEDST